MIVEFAGVAGSGKTTVFQKFTKSLKAAGADFVRFHKAAKTGELTTDAAKQAFQKSYPGVADALGKLSDMPSYELKNADRACHVWMSGLHEMEKRGGQVIGLVDEGYLHRAAYIAAPGRARSAFRNILDQLPRPDVLVLVHVSLDEARRRYVNRMPTPERQEVAARRYDRRYTDHRYVRDMLEDGLAIYRKMGVITQKIENMGDVRDDIDDLVARVLDR